MRLIFAQTKGPIREIHAGAGYWSQDSVTQILATPEPLRQIWIRWPGGRSTTTDIPPNATSIEVEPSGNLRVSNKQP